MDCGELASFVMAVNGAEIILGALAGVAFQAGHAWWVRHRSDKGAAFAGTWHQEILALDDLPRRIDEVTLSQDGSLVFGEFHRQEPIAERGRQWAINGYVYGNRAVLYFYTITPEYDPSSFGMISLARDTDNKMAQAWYGVYFRPDNESFDDIVNDRMLGREIYPDVVDGGEEVGGVPSRLLKTDAGTNRQEGTPWEMFAGSTRTAPRRLRSRWTSWPARALAG